jgi:hypothetical protein
MTERALAPEVVALLEKIAADPESSLLHVPRERLLRYVGHPEETVSPHGSYLSKAEKHLVAAYREQAAWLLLEACVLRLKEDPLVFSTLAPAPENLRRVAGRVWDTLGGEEPALGGVAAGTEVSCLALASASLRLAPSTLALNCLALAHQQEGQARTSLRTLHRLLDDTCPSHQRAQALENMARAHVMLQEFQEAFACDYRASLIDERKVRFIVCCLTDALQGGEERKALESAARLGRRGEDLSHFVRGLRLGRENGTWAPTPASLQLLSRIRRHMPERSGVICDVFA